jgi:hypothetical protein
MPTPDLSVYERQRRAVDQNYASQSATNQYARFLSQQRGDRQVGDYRRDFSRSAPRFGAAWGRRGLTGGGVRSGSYQQGLGNYLGDYTRGLGRLAEDQANESRTFDMNDANYAAMRESALADIEADKQRTIAATAAHLRELAPLLGL